MSEKQNHANYAELLAGATRVEIRGLNNWGNTNAAGLARHAGMLLETTVDGTIILTSEATLNPDQLNFLAVMFDLYGDKNPALEVTAS